MAVSTPSARAAEPSAPLARLTRLNPWLSPTDPLQLPMRVRSLVADDYSFFRSSAELYYDWCRENTADWLADRREFLRLHGDAHPGNTGTYRIASTSNREIRFGVVDPDETFVGPFELDLLRAATSLRAIARANRLALDEGQFRRLTERLLDAYADGLAADGKSDKHKHHTLVHKLIEEARRGDLKDLAEKFCDGHPPNRFRPVRIKKNNVSDLLTPVDDATRREVVRAVRDYVRNGDAATVRALLRFKRPDDAAVAIRDVARWTRIDSGGSQGVVKYLVLLDHALADSDAPLILQLKEEPVPAAARVGQVSATSGVQRAQEVARAYRQMLDEPAWLVGFTHIGDRGFLVRPKDPFGEEPSAADFRDADGLDEGARIMGHALGRAHRAALRDEPDGPARLARIESKLKGLAGPLDTRSREAWRALSSQRQSLVTDPIAQSYAASAQRHIDQAAKDAHD